MTLNSRNRLFLFGFIVLAVQIAVQFIIALTLFFLGNLAPLPQDLPVSGSLLGLFFSQNYNAGICNIVILSLYATITGFILLARFEKTIAPEIMYYATFLFGVFLESYRLFIPFFDLWSGYRPVLTMVGKASFAGRLLTMFCLVYTSFPASEGFVHDTDKNIGIIACVSVLFATIIPIHTGTILPSVAVSYSFGHLFLIIHILLFWTSIITIVFTNRFPRFYGLLLTYAGYLMLSVSACYAFTIIGTVMLLGGTTLFLVKLHAFYLWK